MLKCKKILQTKLFLFIFNHNIFCNNKNILNELMFGFYFNNKLLNSNLLNFLLFKLIHIIKKFLCSKSHVLLIFSSVITKYFLLSVACCFLKKQHKISIVNENCLDYGQFKNLNLLKNVSKKIKFFNLLTGFQFKPQISFLFGVENFFIIKDFVNFDLPFVLITTNVTFLKIQNCYVIPYYKNENFIFIFLIKYSFLR